MDLQPRRCAQSWTDGDQSQCEGSLCDLHGRLTVLDSAVQEELTGDKTCGHHHPGAETCEESAEAGLLGQRDEAVGHGTLRSVTLVDL